MSEKMKWVDESDVLGVHWMPTSLTSVATFGGSGVAPLLQPHWQLCPALQPIST